MKLHRISAEERKFGLIFGIALCMIGTIQLFKGHAKSYIWFYLVGVSIFTLGIIAPNLIRPIHIILAKIAHLISELITKLTLILVFYVILTPVSLIAKLFGKYFLDIDWKKNQIVIGCIKKKQPQVHGDTKISFRKIKEETQHEQVVHT